MVIYWWVINERLKHKELVTTNSSAAVWMSQALSVTTAGKSSLCQPTRVRMDLLSLQWGDQIIISTTITLPLVAWLIIRVSKPAQLQKIIELRLILRQLLEQSLEVHLMFVIISVMSSTRCYEKKSSAILSRKRLVRIPLWVWKGKRKIFKGKFSRLIEIIKSCVKKSKAYWKQIST